MWAMEYNPNTYLSYEEAQHSESSSLKNGDTKMNYKQLKQYGKFERKNMKTGGIEQKSALAVFLVAGVLEAKNKQLLKEAKGLDDVVQVLCTSFAYYFSCRYPVLHTCCFTLDCVCVCTVNYLQILGELTGKLDAKKALKEALKAHSKYLSKVSIILAALPFSLSQSRSLVDTLVIFLDTLPLTIYADQEILVLVQRPAEVIIILAASPFFLSQSRSLTCK